MQFRAIFLCLPPTRITQLGTARSLLPLVIGDKERIPAARTAPWQQLSAKDAGCPFGLGPHAPYVPWSVCWVSKWYARIINKAWLAPRDLFLFV